MVLAVDGSASVTYEEFGLIAGGMAAALARSGGGRGAGRDQHPGACCCGPAPGSRTSSRAWTRIATAADLAAFADGVDNMPRTVRAGATAIGEALLASLTLLAAVPAVPKRNIVNVIGDGRSNDGIAPGPIRDRMAAGGITINGLCILHEEPDLLASYTDGGDRRPGSFAVTCRAYADFAEAMRQKLTREVQGPIV